MGLWTAWAMGAIRGQINNAKPNQTNKNELLQGALFKSPQRKKTHNISVPTIKPCPFRGFLETLSLLILCMLIISNFKKSLTIIFVAALLSVGFPYPKTKQPTLRFSISPSPKHALTSPHLLTAGPSRLQTSAQLEGWIGVFSRFLEKKMRFQGCEAVLKLAGKYTRWGVFFK